MKNLEILTMLRKGFHNLDNVAQGFYNELLDTLDKLPEEKKEVSKQRLKECMNCDFMVRNAVESGMYENQLTQERCSICKCFINKKAFAYNDYCALSDVVIDEEGIMYNIDIQTDTLFYITDNVKYKEALESITQGYEERVINNKKYKKFIIPRKFDRYESND